MILGSVVIHDKMKIDFLENQLATSYVENEKIKQEYQWLEEITEQLMKNGQLPQMPYAVSVPQI